MPWCNKGFIIESRVDSCPPCIEEVDVNTAAGLPTNVPDIHKELVESTKLFIAALMFPNRVGLPKIKPSHCARSSS